MNAANLPTEQRQAALEARAASLKSIELDSSTDLKAGFGGATEWVIEIGPFRLLLIPFLGEWWFFDELHGEWRFTGKKIGEAQFLLENGGLRVVDMPPPAGESPSPAPSLSTEPDQLPPAAAPGDARHFCAGCGAPIQADWKFCRKCGAKLSDPRQ